MLRAVETHVSHWPICGPLTRFDVFFKDVRTVQPIRQNIHRAPVRPEVVPHDHRQHGPLCLAKRSVKSNSASSKKYCIWPAQRRHCSITPNRPESRSPLCHGNRKSAQPSPAPRGTPRTCDKDACPRPSPGATPLPSALAHGRREAPTAQPARCRLRIRCGQVQTLVPRALQLEAAKHDFRIPTCFPTYGTTGPPVRERKTPVAMTGVFEKESRCPPLRLCSRHQPDPPLRIKHLKEETA